jgi:hypothetical protein
VNHLDKKLHRRCYVPMLPIAAAFGVVITIGSPTAQTLGTSTIAIQYPDGTSNSYDVPISPGMTVESAMKLASVIGPPFKWTAVWYGSLDSYQVIAVNDFANDKYVDANSRFWQFCGGPKGSPQPPATRGISLFGLAPNE